MKKQYVFVIGLIMALYLPTRAQVPNAGFEDLTLDSTMQYWGKTYIFSIVIDTTGNPVDTIVIDHALYFSTTDAHTGNYAAEMRNGYNPVTNEQIVGSIILSDNEDGYPGFSTALQLPVSGNPGSFNFYYKFLPVNTDSAVGYAAIYDTEGIQIGEAEIVLGGTVTEYTLASRPIVYSAPGEAAYFSMYFATARNGTPGSLGTRFLVDDVSLTGNAGLQNSVPGKNTVNLYPNPAGETVTLFSEVPLPADARLQLTDATGKTVYAENATQAISIVNLPAGTYFWTLTTGKTVTNRGKLIKK